LPGKPADSETTQADPCRHWRRCVGSLGNDPQVQARMRALVEDYLATPSRWRRHW
jgi:hypothetical protein